MGIFDRFNDRMRDIGKFGETIKRSLEPAQSQLVLDDDHATWAQKAAAHLRLDWEFARFSDRIKALVETAAQTLVPLTEEKTIESLPERARTANQIHAHELAQKARKILIATSFEDLYHYDEDHQRLLAAAEEFRGSATRNIAALHEHLGPQVDAALAAVQAIEDETIRFAQLLEDRKFPHVKRLREAHQELVALDERRAKEQELLTHLRADSGRTDERIAGLEGGIREEEGRIRNEEARTALTRLVELEEELERLVGPIQQAARDALRYWKKHSDLTPPSGAKQAMDDLDRDAARALSNGAERIAGALTAVSEAITQDARPNTRPLATRLEHAGQQAEEIGLKASGLLPEQSRLRREIMRDVAALGAYDKRQFLLAARREAGTLGAKISFLEEDLDPGKRIAHERALKDAALALGASIPGEPISTAVPAAAAPEARAEPPVDTAAEIEQAEATLAKAQELLTGGKKTPAKKRKGKG